MSLPYVEDVIVIRRRLRINEQGRTEESLLLWATTKDEDSVISLLEKSKWKVGHRDWQYEPDMKMEGLSEPQEAGGST